ncbi:MAG TPA: tetratricopeptide repeat protein [Kiritimatiellia bacterium]|nr:tetratricopeptide repeat protein [Kiritimatiellia bacterium]
MNTEKQDPQEEAAPVAKPAIETNIEEFGVPEVMDFLKENGLAIVIGVAVAVAAFVGISAWRGSKAAKVETASTLLANAQSIPQFQEIIANYGETKVAPLAYLSLAGAYFDQAQYDLARHTFIQFQQQFPTHDMLPNAELGIAQSLEAAGNLQEALAGYDAFLARRGSHYMAHSATFGKGRVLEAMGRLSEARQVYEEFIAANPESRWTARAETGLDFVKKAERAARNSP